MYIVHEPINKIYYPIKAIISEYFSCKAKTTQANVRRVYSLLDFLIEPSMILLGSSFMCAKYI